MASTSPDERNTALGTIFLRINLEPLANQFLIDLMGLDILEPDVAADCRAQAAMAQDLAHQLVVSGLLLENYGAGGVPELVRRDSQTRELEDALGDLAAEGDFALGTASHPGEQVVLVSAPQQRRPEVVDIFVDQRCVVWLDATAARAAFL